MEEDFDRHALVAADFAHFFAQVAPDTRIFIRGSDGLRYKTKFSIEPAGIVIEPEEIAL